MNSTKHDYLLHDEYAFEASILLCQIQLKDENLTDMKKISFMKFYWTNTYLFVLFSTATVITSWLLKFEEAPGITWAWVIFNVGIMGGRFIEYRRKQ